VSRIFNRIATISLLAAVFCVISFSIRASEDGYDGLPEGEGREEVYIICSGYHSIKLVAQQGLSRDSWQESLDWMVEEQGMPEMDPETQSLVIDYLAKYLGTDHRPPP